MNERRLPLDQTVLDLQSKGEHALNDWLAIGDTVSTIRICLEDPAQNSLAAALIVLDAQLTLAGGGSEGIESRLLAEGGVDVVGREGATPAAELRIPRLPRGAQTAMAAARDDRRFSAAARLSLNGDAAVILVGIAAHPIRARQIESVVRGRTLDDRIIDLAAQTARSEAQPYGVGDLTDGAAINHVEDAVRRLFRRLRDRLDAAQPNARRHLARRR